MSTKLTVIYDNPDDPAAFDRHYRETHIPLAARLAAVRRAELAKVYPRENGSPTPAYRIAELYFDTYEEACAALASPEGEALMADARELGKAGVTFLLSEIEH